MCRNYKKLLGRIVEKVGTQAEFSKKIGLSEHSVSLKLNGKTPFKQREIIAACSILDISNEEIGSYFFNEKVQSN